MGIRGRTGGAAHARRLRYRAPSSLSGFPLPRAGPPAITRRRAARLSPAPDLGRSGVVPRDGGEAPSAGCDARPRSGTRWPSRPAEVELYLRRRDDHGALGATRPINGGPSNPASSTATANPNDRTTMSTPLPDLLSLGDFAETYFPGGKTRTMDGFAVTCPVCRTESSLQLRDLYGRLAVACLTRDCSGNFAEALGMTEARWEMLLDTVRTDTADAPATPTRGAGSGKAKSADGDGRLSADDVVTWIEANYRLGRSTDGLLFAVPVYAGSNRVAREVRSIRSDVLRRFREDRKARTGKGVVIGSETMTAALGLVAALAEDAQEHPEPVALRAAQVGNDRVVLDLGDTSGRVVEASPAGWTVTDPCEAVPLFRRSSATQPLPEPVRGGSLETLRELLGLDADDRRWLIVRGWLVASLFAEVPRPILWATGSQGSGKSVRTRMVLSVIEPADSLGKEPGRNERDDSTAARGRFLVSYDNITTVSQNTSDWLCRLVTGVTDDRRALYTDDDLRPVSYRRSGVATSITLPPGLGSDALERIALVPLDRVPDSDRRGEAQLWAAYKAAHPQILGAVLDDLVGVLRHLEDVKREA